MHLAAHGAAAVDTEAAADRPPQAWPWEPRKRLVMAARRVFLHFPSTTSTRVFQMAKPFNVEQANLEARCAEQDPHRRIVFALPRTSGVESFLANLPALHLNGPRPGRPTKSCRREPQRRVWKWDIDMTMRFTIERLLLFKTVY
jgi:hypothetical protein